MKRLSQTYICIQALLEINIRRHCVHNTLNVQKLVSYNFIHSEQKSSSQSIDVIISVEPQIAVLKLFKRHQVLITISKSLVLIKHFGR